MTEYHPAVGVPGTNNAQGEVLDQHSTAIRDIKARLDLLASMATHSERWDSASLLSSQHDTAIRDIRVRLDEVAETLGELQRNYAAVMEHLRAFAQRIQALEGQKPAKGIRISWE